MNKSFFFFSVNRHQKRYFDSLLSAIKSDDKAISYHKRQLLFILPFFKFDKYDLSLARNSADIRRQYYKNKTGHNSSYLRGVLYLLSSMLFVLKVKKILSVNHNDLIVLWNDMKWHQLIVRKLAGKQGIRTAFFENGALPNTVTLDSTGVNFNNSIPRARAYYASKITEEKPTPSVISTISDSEESYIFVPFQVDYDTQIISHSPWIEDMDNLYRILKNLVRNLPENIKVYVKEHPSSSRCYDYLHHLDNRIEFKNEVNTKELIEKAKLVLTINSTVGLEAIIENKPVIVLGNAFYCIDGLCLQAQNEEDLLNKVMGHTYPDSMIRTNFIKFLVDEYYVSGQWKLPTEEHFNAVWKRLYDFMDEC